MPELEIHHETGHESDPMGQKVGILAAVLAVALAIVTIASHRTHTAAIMHKSTANDEWSHYQSTRVKFHNLDLGENLLASSTRRATPPRRCAPITRAQKKKYEEQGKEIQEKAQASRTRPPKADEHRALRYDIGEGLLEIGLVLSSLYFISKKKMFPVMGVTAGRDRDGGRDHRAASVPEVPHAGEHHRHAQAVRRRDHLLIAHRAAGLDERCRAVLRRFLHAVREREERVRRDHRSASGSTAFIAPSFTESTRLIWPAPTPTVCPARAYTIAFDFTCLATFQPNSSARPFFVGRRALASSPRAARDRACASSAVCAR